MELVNDVVSNQWKAQAEGPAREAFTTTLEVRKTKLEQLPELVSELAIFPQDHALIYQLSVRLVKEKKYLQAEHVLRTLLKKENCFEVLEALSICLYHLGKWNECAHIARQALMLGEGFRDQRFELLKFLGNSLIQTKDLEGAQEAYEKAFAIFPGSDVLQVNFGTLYIQQSDWNRATECFRYALFLKAENDRAWVGLALCHQVRGDFELARANLERALDANPLNETALSVLNDWSTTKAEFDRVKEHFINFTDAGGFSKTLSEAFITKARQYGETEMAGWEEFHVRVRGDQADV